MFYASWTWQTSVKQTWTIQMWPGTIPFTVSRTPNPTLTGYTTSCGVKGFNTPVFTSPASLEASFGRLPAPVRVPQGGRGQAELQPGEEDPCRRLPVRKSRRFILGQ